MTERNNVAKQTNDLMKRIIKMNGNINNPMQDTHTHIACQNQYNANNLPRFYFHVMRCGQW